MPSRQKTGRQRRGSCTCSGSSDCMISLNRLPQPRMWALWVAALQVAKKIHFSGGRSFSSDFKCLATNGLQPRRNWFSAFFSRPLYAATFQYAHERLQLALRHEGSRCLCLSVLAFNCVAAGLQSRRICADMSTQAKAYATNDLEFVAAAF